MPIILTDVTAQLTLRYSGPYFASGGGATVIGLRAGEPWQPSDLLVTAQEAVDAWEDQMQGITSDNVTLAGARIVCDVLSAEVGASLQGAVTVDSNPPNVAVLARYSTAFRGRRGRGRSYLPGLAPDSQISDFGIINETDRDVFEDHWINYLSAVVESTPGIGFQVILQNSEGSSEPITPAPAVIARNIDPKVASQRRRLRP